MSGWNESVWFSMFLGAALKSTIVLGAAWILALLLRGRSAAARHLVWTAAAAAVLALPLLTLALPALRVPVSSETLPANTSLVFRAIGIAGVDDSSVPVTSPAPPHAAASQAAFRRDTRFWLLMIWAAGAAASLLKMSVSYVALWRMRRHSLPLDDCGLTSSLAKSLEIEQPVPVFETASGGMPMTFGFLRPAVFMPSDCVAWTEERRRVVLLHELAHVRRGDAATHLLARTALSLNWWNPLAWIAWREFLKERERATDDLVLRAGARASEYASHLLEVARSMHTTALGSSAAVAMARRSQLEGRLLAILDSRVNRTPIAGAGTPALIAMLAVLLVAPFAAVRAQDPVPAPPVAPEIDATIRAANAQKNHEILEYAAAAYEKLRNYDTAQTLLESALTIRGEVSGQQSAAYAAGLVKLGDLEAKRNRPVDAANFYTKAVSLGDRPEVAPALVYLGMRAYGKKDYAQATDLLQRAINVAPSGPEAGRAYTWMAAVREAQAGGAAAPLPTFQTTTVYNTTTQKYDLLTSAEVESLLQKALTAEPPDSLDTAVTLELYARFLRNQDRQGEATPIANRAAEIRRQSIAADPSLNSATLRSTTAVKVGGGISAPVVLSKTDPAYTEEARAAKYQGTVLLGVEIGPDGKAQNVQVVRSLGLGLDEKAIEAVKQWRFKPGMKDGQPVTVQANIEVNFRLL
ncbi:MAG TPA: TonB family protein [Bryobacteraceae bacterium]|nr:TonB family protein [Bryobacteraceae bacterium]